MSYTALGYVGEYITLDRESQDLVGGTIDEKPLSFISACSRQRIPMTATMNCLSIVESMVKCFGSRPKALDSVNIESVQTNHT